MNRRLVKFAITSLAAVVLVLAAVVLYLIFSDPEIPDEVFRQRLEAKLLGHDVSDSKRVFAEEHIESTNELGMDGVLRDAGHADIVMMKRIYVRVHSDAHSKITSIETSGMWIGP